MQWFTLYWTFLSSVDEEGNGQSESEERLPDLPLLSEQLLLDELWDMLGECLKELEESHDQHAVLGRRNPSDKMHFFETYASLIFLEWVRRMSCIFP